MIAVKDDGHAMSLSDHGRCFMSLLSSAMQIPSRKSAERVQDGVKWQCSMAETMGSITVRRKKRTKGSRAASWSGGASPASRLQSRYTTCVRQSGAAASAEASHDTTAVLPVPEPPATRKPAGGGGSGCEGCGHPGGAAVCCCPVLPAYSRETTA